MFGSSGVAREESRDAKDAHAEAADGARGGGRGAREVPATSREDGVDAHRDTIAIETETTEKHAERVREYAVARRAAAVAAAQKARDLGLVPVGRNAIASREASASRSASVVLGIEADGIARAAKQFRRPFATEQEMVEAWHASRDESREEYKRQRRQALRRQKSLRAAVPAIARSGTART